MSQRATIALVVMALVSAIALAQGAKGLSPSDDLAGSAAAGWYCGPTGQSTVTDDHSRVHSGESSIHFRTESDSDTWLGFRPAPEADWDVSKFDYVEFWLWVEHDAGLDSKDVGYHYFSKDNHFDNEGFFRIGDSDGNYFEFTPANAHEGYKLLSSALRQISEGWVLFRVPLEGNNRWTVTGHGKPDLKDIDYFELHGRSKGKGFDVWLDGLRFSKAGATPPSPRDPPPGVNPDAIEVKLLVYIINPILESEGGK